MAKKTIGMGVIGVGGISGNHINGTLKSPDAALAAICDINPARLREIGERHGVPEAMRFTDHRALLAHPAVRAVSICTPNDAHVPIALDAVRAGKPFAVEKPLATNAADARKLADAVAKAGLPAMVCFSYRFRASALFARDIIASGALGRLRHVYVRYLQAWGNPERDCARVWRFDAKAAGSGALGDLGSHMLDLVRFLTADEYTGFVADNGTFVRERRAPAGGGAAPLPVDVDDYSHFFARTQGGAAASFEISRFCFGRGNFQRIEIYGDKGALAYELEREDSLWRCADKDQEENCRFDRIPVPVKYRVNQMQKFFDLVNGKNAFPAASIADGALNQQHLDAVLRAGFKPAEPAAAIRK